MIDRRHIALWVSLTCLFTGLSLLSIAAVPPSHPDISKVLDLVVPEAPTSDLWVYQSGDVGLKQRVLDVFHTGRRRGEWASFRGGESPYDAGSSDDLRWQGCLKLAKTEGPDMWVVCVETDRLYKEVNP